MRKWKDALAADPPSLSVSLTINNDADQDDEDGRDWKEPGNMAHDRRSLLASQDLNTYSMTGVKPSKIARPSMIPRQSVLPSRVPSSSNQENNMLNASLKGSAVPRSSMAVGMGYPGAAPTGYNMDIDMGASSSAATPHRIQAAQLRRVESTGRMSVAPTPKRVMALLFACFSRMLTCSFAALGSRWQEDSR